MPIHINCPICGQRLRVSNYAAGRITKCNACGNAVHVPKPKAMLNEGEDEDETEQGKKSQSNETPAGPLTPSEVWYRSIERLSGSLDWMAERPARIVFVALVLVAAYLGVATAKWALSKPPEGPIVVQEPVDTEPWDGVGTADGNERVRVNAQSTTEPIEILPPNMSVARKTPSAYLKITLKIENIGDTDLKYTGWSNNTGKTDQFARLRDDTGQSHKQVAWRAKIIGQTSSATIKPKESLTDILIFDPPATYIRYLKLSLPAQACEGSGELRIKLPRVRVLD